MRAIRIVWLGTWLLASMATARAVVVTFTWDPNGILTGTGTGGGVWNTTTPNWFNAEALVWLNDGSVQAVFPISSTPGTEAYDAGGDYTVDVASNVYARGLGLGSAVWSSNAETTFSGSGSITLTDPLVTVESTTATFNVPLISSVGLTLDVSFNYGGYLKLNTANPNLQGLTTITEGTLIYNHAGALGPETAGNGISIGAAGTLNFNYVSGGDFSYTLADAIAITGVSEFSSHLTIGSETYATRSVTLTGPITLQSDLKIEGGSLSSYGSAKIISSGVISGTDDVLIEGDVGLSGTNTFTGQVRVGAEGGDDGRLTIPVFNNDGVAGPLGAGTGLRIGYNNGEGGSEGEIVYTGGTATSNRTMQIDLGAALTVENTATTLTLTGVISGVENSSGDFEKRGAGALVLRGNNTFSGRTELSNGTLVLGHSNALGTGTSTVRIGYSGSSSGDNVGFLLEDGVTFGRKLYVYNNNYSGSTTIGMTGTGSSTFSGEVYLTRNVEVKVGSGATQIFSGFLNDGVSGGSVTKTGSGTAVFSGGVDLRGGSIDVSQGTLRLSNNVVLPSSLYVRSGAKLVGTPTVTLETGALTVQSGGTIQPGLNGSGTFTTENISLASGSFLNWQLASLTTSGTPLLALSTSDGNTMISSGASISVDFSLLGSTLRPDAVTPDAFWSTGHDWTVISFASPSTETNLLPGTLNPMMVTNGSFSTGAFTTFMSGSGDLMLQFSPIPEPSTWALFGTGALALFGSRWRRRRSRVSTQGAADEPR